ncbi:alpha/beta hydrolase [Gordonia sp. HY002]|uniref:alpha/beta fold hydrolase n=1 Tax=Gordonia zhenghanii TaxID=2911516 RepID=UPI001EF01CA5|nr:alpha/beta hydrolase [Gordonia zhenghanii]MCF8569038.1 alpha/beta hydrolase [Gordonia zhenghanii]MCF8605252.1 alpha/beta hydrolase [Gordonia zhenghanii]
MADSRRGWRRGVQALAVAGGLGAGIVGGGLAVIAGSLLREAFRYPTPVQDGPDLMLQEPSNTKSSVVAAADGTLLHVVTSGDVDAADEILVFVHGWTCNTGFWNGQMRHFGEARAMVAYDQRGHGLSELGKTKLSPDLLGQDLQAVLDEVVPDGKRAVLIGHSMGGMSIMSWAAQFGAGMEEKVSAIVLTSTGAFTVVQRQLLVPEDLPALVRPLEPYVERAFVSTPLPIPTTPLSERITHYIALGPVARQAHVDFSNDQIAACSPTARGAWGATMYDLDVRLGLDKITVPTAVVVGSQDRLTSPVHAEELADVLRANGVLHSLTEFPGAGHMLPIERAPGYNRLLDTVLGDVSAAKSS